MWKQRKTVKGNQIIIMQSLSTVKELYFLLKYYRWCSELYPISCFIDTETSTRRKKLTTWWTDCGHGVSCHNSKNWLQLGTNQSWIWRLTVLETIKMTLVWPLKTNFKMLVRADCVVSACRLPSPRPMSINALIHSLSFGKSWHMDWCLPFSFTLIC